jgi:hydroxyethylthiazole kinase-like uncharacterized protein yjeF
MKDGMKILSAAQMREVDRRTVESGFASWLELMESAGTAVAECAIELYPKAHKIAIVCGKGNNGGDGLVAARLLAQRGKQVSVLLCSRAPELSPDATAMYERLNAVEAVRIQTVLSEQELTSALSESEIILDALLGTGIRPPVEGFYRAVIDALNGSNKPILAVDLPSGADADNLARGPMVNAFAVVTFTAPKRWHVWSDQSDLPTAIAPIGSPRELVAEIAAVEPQLFTARDLPVGFFDRKADSNKGLYGHVLIIGGALGKSGAPAMAAIAALRSGAGLATVATPGAVLNTVASYAPELMTEPLDGPDAECITSRALGAVRKLAENKSVLAVGPGIGRDLETESFVHRLIAQSELPIVLDADALNAFEHRADLLDQHRSEHLVLTPHPGEMSRLAGISTKEVQADRIGVATRFAREHRCTVVLKGWRTAIAFADGEVWINPTGNPAMSKGGTGDALTGIIAAWLGQKRNEPKLAVLTAVCLHGFAGDLLLPRFGMHGLLTTDLIAEVPEATMRLAAEQRRGDVWLHRSS